MEKILAILLLAIVTITLARTTSKPSDLNCQSCTAVNSRSCCKEKKQCCTPRTQPSQGSTLNQHSFSCNQSLCLKDADCTSKKCQINQQKFCIPKGVYQYYANMTTPPSAADETKNEEETRKGEEGGDEETPQDENQEAPGQDEAAGEEAPGDDEATGEEAPGDDEATGEEAPGDDEATGEEAPGDDETAGEEAPGDDETAGEEAPGDDETAGEEAPGDDETAGEEAPVEDGGDEPEQDAAERRKRHLVIEHHIRISTCNEDSDCTPNSVCKEYDIGCCSEN